MTTVELPIVHVIPRFSQFLCQPAPAAFDRQNSVLVAVTDENPGLADVMRGLCEAWREGENVAKQIAIHESHGERIGCTIREPGYGDAACIDREPPEGDFKSVIDKLDVGPVGAFQDIP